MPFSDWLQHRFFHPDTEDEMRVLGMHGAQELTHSRDRFYNTIQNIHSPQAEKGHGGDTPLSDDELAALQLHAAGLDPALREAAKTYHDVHHVPVPLPELGHAGPHFGPLGAFYPTGARIGHISSLGPSWLETPEAAQWAATGHTTHPWITGIELATLAPFGRPIRGARAIATALRTGGDEAARIASERAAEIEARLSERETRLLALARANQAAGRGLTQEQSAVLHRIERELVNPRKSVYRSVMEGRSLVGAGVAKGTSKIRYRTFRAGGEEVQIPAARAYTGRAIEGVADALRRHADGKMPLFKSEAERALEEATRGQKYRNRVEEGKIARLQQLGQRLSDEQEYAIRLVLEQSPPDVAYLHHVELMKSADTEEQRVYHAMHAAIIERAKKYLRVDDAGEVHLIEDLPHPKIAKAFGDKPPMREAFELMQEVAQGREDIYKAMGLLSDEAIARRIAGPARVRKGARFVEAEDELRQALKDSPIRPQIEAAARATAERMTDDPKRQRIAVEASMSLWEARIRAAALRYAGNQREWPQIIAYLRGVEVGSTEIPQEALTQNMDDLMQRFQAGEISLDEFNAAMSGEAFTKRTLSNAYVLGQPLVTATGERGITVEDLGDAVRANFDGTERVVPKSEIPDAPQPGETTLFQRGGGLEGVGPFGVKGFTSYSGPAHAVEAVVGFTKHADLSTFVHEVFGHWLAPFVPDNEYRSLVKWAGGNFDQSRGPIDVAAAEKVAEGWEKYILEGRGPTPVRQAVRSLAPFLRELYDGADLPDLTPRVREIFDRALAHEKLKGGRLVGPEDFEEVGIARVATFPGRPLPSGIRSVRPRVAGMSAYILSRGKVVGRGTADKALHNEYRGAALISGYFTADAVAPTARDAFLAVRLATVHRVRESLIRAGSEIPSDYTDIAVKINPDKTTPKNVAITLDKMREIDAKGGKLSRADMEQIDFDILEEGGRDVMPHQLLDAEGNPKDIREWAQEVMNTQEPIENIVWVPRDWIDASGLMPPTGRMAHLMAGVRGGKGMMAVDAINDLQKIMVLYLNPSYIPVNLVGNLVMNTMHQGVFTPVNLWRSALMHQWLEGWERKTIDRAMGNGLTASLALRSGPGQIVHSTLGYWINQAVDLIPRRAAWLHEARRAGYKSKEQVRDLIRRAESGDEAAMHDMEMIARTANDAIVDYERMSPLEREITSRLIFFYPWLKGASRYSIRFAVEHPVQFTALALAAEHAYAVQQGELGLVPFYEFTDIPVSTKSIGVGRYSLADVFGEHEWRRGGLPMVVDARQILTFTTPMDIYRAGFALVTGDKNAPSLVDNLTPFVGASMVALQGYDPFRHQEVPRSLGTFLKQFEQVPQVQKWKLLTMSPEERRIYMEKSINPRTREEAWWYTFGSGLAPSRYNPKVAAKRLLSDAPTKIRHKTELTEGAKQFGLGPVTDQILNQQSEFLDFEHELKTGMKSTEKLDVATKYLRLHPDLRHAGDIDRVIQEHVHTQGDAENLYRAIRHDLEYHAWGDYWRMKTDLAHKQKKATGKEKVSG